MESPPVGNEEMKEIVASGRLPAGSRGAVGSRRFLRSRIGRSMLAVRTGSARMLGSGDLGLDQFRQPTICIILVIRPGNLSVGRVDDAQEWTQILWVDFGVGAFGVEQGPALGRMIEGMREQDAARRDERRRSATCLRRRGDRWPTCRSCPSQKTRFGERREANVRRRGEQEGPGTNAVTAESAFGIAVSARRRALLASIKN